MEEGQGEVTVHGDYVEVKKPVAGRLESSGTTIEVSGGGGLLSNWKKRDKMPWQQQRKRLVTRSRYMVKKR